MYETLFLSDFLFYLKSAARLERSSFLLVAELVVAVEPVETKPAIKKAGALRQAQDKSGGNVCPNNYFTHRNHLLRHLFLQFFYVGPGNVLRTKCKLGAINRA